MLKNTIIISGYTKIKSGCTESNAKTYIYINVPVTLPLNILIVCYKIALRKHILIIYIGNPCTRHENIANKKKVKQLSITKTVKNKNAIEKI